MSFCTLALLGSTGSIGKSALAVARALPDRIRVSLLAAGKNWELLAEQAREFRPDCVCLEDAAHLDELRAAVPAGCKVISGREALCEAVAAPAPSAAPSPPPTSSVPVAVSATAVNMPTRSPPISAAAARRNRLSSANSLPATPAPAIIHPA